MSDPKFVYLLGFLWSDGYISKTTNAVQIEVTKDDFSDLNKVFSVISFTHYFRQRHDKDGEVFGRPLVKFHISSSELKSFLVGHDYLNKSIMAPIKILSSIPKNLVSYWWLGHFDGDGCFYKAPRIGGSLSIWSTIEQDWSAHIKLLTDLGVSYRIKKYIRKGGQHKSSALVSTNRDSIIKFGNYLYSQGLLGLDRKRQKFLEIKNYKSTSTEVAHKRKGVTYQANTGKWVARKTIGGKRLHIGSFSTEEKAIEAYASALLSMTYDLRLRVSVST